MKPNPAAAKPTDHRSNSLTLALIYASFAGLWILLSDQAAAWLFRDPADYVMASTLKGLLFVVVTTLLLYSLMRRLGGGAAAMSVGKGLGWPFLLLVVLVTGLTAVLIHRGLARGEGVAAAAWVGMAGLLTLVALAAALLMLRQRAQLHLAHATRQAQDERLRALKLLAAIADSSEDAIFALDLAGRFVLFNRAAERHTGKSTADILGKDETALFPPALADVLMADNRWVIEHDTSKLVEETLPTEAGERTILTTKSPLRDEAGKVVGLLGISRDISERKQSEAALMRLADDLSATLRAIPDLLFELDADGRYLKVEATAQQLLAAPADQLLGHTVGEMLPPEAGQSVMEALAGAARFGADYGRTITLPLPEGIRHFELSVARKAMAAGERPHFIVLSRDITARQAAEEELRRNNEELQRFNRATVGRELDMLEMKKRINTLSRELGREPPFPLAFLDEDAKGGMP
jgi:PAS domain S-box-containing protein